MSASGYKNQIVDICTEEGMVPKRCRVWGDTIATHKMIESDELENPSLQVVTDVETGRLIAVFHTAKYAAEMAVWLSGLLNGRSVSEMTGQEVMSMIEMIAQIRADEASDKFPLRDVDKIVKKDMEAAEENRRKATRERSYA